MSKWRYTSAFAAVLLILLIGDVILSNALLKSEYFNKESDLKTESELNVKGNEDSDQQSGEGAIQNIPIRVVIMTSGYTDYLHDLVSLNADSGLSLCYGEREEEWKDGVLTLLPDDPRFGSGKIVVAPLSDTDEIRVESIERGCGIPSYAGRIEVWSDEEGMAIINELPLESYLCKVVPSEMPSSYETEALKVQAVCARSYAVRQMQDYAYPQYEAHVNDSTEFQVYNNSYPADRTSQAVVETKGQVVWYRGTIATTYYFSTSCGKTTDMEAWGNAVTEGNAYLQSVNVCGEDGDYEKDLPWYRWSACISQDVMKSLIENYAGADIGILENVEVTRRGDGDIALELTATGTKETVVISTENKIRTALGGKGYSITKNDGTTVESQKLLPSAFFEIEKKETTYYIEGGGYGHGIGMSQNGANEMAKEGKDYKEILNLFYSGISVSVEG